MIRAPGSACDCWSRLRAAARRGVAGTAMAQPPTPPLTGAVNDFASVIDPQSKAELERRINALMAATGDVVVVATVPNIEGFADIDEFAVKMFENGGRGIGEKGKDNGLLIVVAVAERQIGDRGRLRPRGVHHRRHAPAR